MIKRCKKWPMLKIKFVVNEKFGKSPCTSNLVVLFDEPPFSHEVEYLDYSFCITLGTSTTTYN